MLMLDAVKNSVIDKITGRDTAVGPSSSYLTTSYGGQFTLYTGAQLPLGSAPTAVAAASSAGALMPWQSAGGGIATISEPIVTTAGAHPGTVAFARFFNTSYVPGGWFDFSVGNPASGAECIVDSTVSATPTITNLSFKLALDYGGMQLSDALANAILNVIWSGVAAPNMGGSGHVYVYTGAAPANAGSAATGTLLLDFATTTTSFASASSGSSALVSSISAVAGAGAAATPGYARWVKGGYVIQGTVGTSGTVFVIDSMSITSGNTYNLTSASITI